MTSFLAFTFISTLFIVSPGPNVLVIVATTLGHGRGRGTTTVMGTSSAMAIQLLIAALSTSALLALVNGSLSWLQWAGVAYLAFLGLRAIRRWQRREQAPKLSGLGSFRRGFLVSLTNPKTILFFAAFLPQFVSESAPYLQQIALLSVWFWLLATLLDLAYVQLAGLLRKRIERWLANGTEHGVAATLYLSASGLLALSSGD